MIKFYNTKPQLHEAQIKNLESKLHFKFPKEYKEHLLKFNGGKCEPPVFTFKENGEFTNSMVGWFFAIYEGEYDNLYDYFKFLKIDEKRMPTTIFPIADDPGGNMICMDAMDGKIYFWDHEREVDYSIYDDSNRDNLYFIANSLKDFLSGLKEIEDEDYE